MLVLPLGKGDMIRPSSTLTPARRRRRQHSNRLPPRRARPRHHHPIRCHLILLAPFPTAEPTVPATITISGNTKVLRPPQHQPHRYTGPRRLHLRSPALPARPRRRRLHPRRRRGRRSPDGESLGASVCLSDSAHHLCEQAGPRWCGFWEDRQGSWREIGRLAGCLWCSVVEW